MNSEVVSQPTEHDKPVDYSGISLGDDFARMGISHSWYKHLSLEGRLFDMSLEYGYNIPYAFTQPKQDEGNLHWYFEPTHVGFNPPNTYQVRLNYCLIYANVILNQHNPNYYLLDYSYGLFNSSTEIQKINERIRTKYPHLSPIEIMDDMADEITPNITEPILAFLKEEYESMFAQVIETANRYYVENQQYFI